MLPFGLTGPQWVNVLNSLWSWTQTFLWNSVIVLSLIQGCFLLYSTSDRPHVALQKDVVQLSHSRSVHNFCQMVPIRHISNTGLPTFEIFFPYFVEKISVFWVTFPYPLICSSPDSKQSFWQLPIYSGGTHPLPVETLVDSFGTTGTGSWQEHMLLPHVEERRLNVLVIKEVFEGFKA